MTLVRTFLYATRDAPVLRVKFGYCTCECLADARRHILTRYRTYLYNCEVLHVIPVALPGRQAEASLKGSLAEFYLDREFLDFPNEATLQRTLAVAYSVLACPEEEAHRVESNRGAEGARRKRAREEAELAAATQAALFAKKLKVERQEAKRERRRLRAEARPCALSPEQQGEKGVDMDAWAKAHISPATGAFVILDDAFSLFQQQHANELKKRHFRELLCAALGSAAPYDTRASVAPRARKAAWLHVRLNVDVQEA